ncbi:hypothetical protein [Clostridium sp. 'White wine YQ']|uniref:hypothetical protein n=1 Tax=Clostridium sp. 'White wine YQ' TaxID=3027474 RepID=UPI002366C4B9|nr:hypothetical protein [Clostridium sp. 'White wine YQ']MDD7793146.1 hypothetical protein [Clostridium sp. 'White wine YQ']
MDLFRPVGKAELELIEKSNYTLFPPRLPQQPIFYPVLNQKYAEEIAQRWNTQDSSSQYKGYVLKFEIDDAYISQFEVQTVGRSYHQELWITAEELENFNKFIVGKIQVIKVFE